MAEEGNNQGQDRGLRLHERLFASADKPWLPIATVLALPIAAALVPLVLLVTSLTGDVEEGRASLFQYQVGSVAVERDTAAKLGIVTLIPPDPRLPMWEKVPDAKKGIFAVPDPQARRDLAEVVAEIKADAAGVVNGTPPSQADILRMQDVLNGFIEDQARDRTIPLYERAVLWMWSGAYGSAVKDLDHAQGVLEKDNLQSTDPGAGALAAIFYLRGTAKLMDLRHRTETPGADEAEIEKLAADAKKDFASARDTMDGIAKRSKIGTVGQFYKTSASRHMVSLSSPKVWLGYLVATAYSDGVKEAAREARPMFDEAVYLGDEPLLAAALALLAAEEGNGSAVDALTNAAGTHTKVGTVDAARFNAAARIVALQSIPPNVSPTNKLDTSVVRKMFEDIYQGAVPLFPRMEFGTDQSAANRLDNWLFFRQWHSSLEHGNLKPVFDDINKLTRSNTTNLAVFGNWRDQVTAKLGPWLLERAADGTTTSRDDAETIYRVLLTNPFPSWIRIDALLHLMFKSWWQLAIIGYPALLLFILVLWMTLIDYRRLFSPMHFTSRMALKDKLRKPAGGSA
jgi:hypothetical protein